MVGAAVFSALLLPRLVDAPRSRRASPATTCSAFSPSSPRSRSASSSRATRSRRWSRDRCSRRCSRQGIDAGVAAASAGPTSSRCFAGIAFTLAAGRLGGAAARASRPCSAACASYFSQPGAGAFLAFIVLYKLGDAFAGSLLTPFLLQAMQYSTAEVGVVNKVIGLWLTIVGALRRRRADDPARPVARADAVRRPADAQQPRLLVAGGERPRRAARPVAAGRSTGASSSSPSRRRSTAAC